MLSASSFSPKEPIYTFITPSGENINIAASKLRLHCMGLDSGPTLRPAYRFKVFDFPIRPALAESFVHDNIISTARVIELLTKPRLDPIIAAVYDHDANGLPNVMLVDGHHRYYLAHAMKLPHIPAFVLQPEEWHPFQISGCPTISQDELRSIPITPRNY